MMKPGRLVCCACLAGFSGLFNPAWGQNFNLKINEIIADNADGETDGFDVGEDWVEIYNPAGNPITNLAGYYLSDDPDSLDKWLIPSTNPGTTTILPNNHLVFWLDKDPEQGEDHVDFSLSADGETLTLTAPDGVTIIDQIEYPLMAPDVSYGRVTDGNAAWQYFNNVTFEDPNAEATMATEILFINEVQVNNVTTFDDPFGDFDPWLEIYNPNPFHVNLAGYYLSATADPLFYQIPNTNPYKTVIPPGGFLLVWCDAETSEDSNHLPFGLAQTGTLTLTSPDGLTAVDTYAYSATGDDQSWGRSTDGSPGSILFTYPTPRASNQTIPVSFPLLYINEIMTSNQNDTLDNYGELEDWIEIYNPNDFDVDLAGYYMTDNPDNPVKWMVPLGKPDSTTVPANGWLLFWADEDAIQGVRHASFRLNNVAEQVAFYSPDGFSLIEELSWQGMQTDTSLGRITDGSEFWWNFTGTTPEYSNNQGVLPVAESASTTLIFYPNPATHTLWWPEPVGGTIYDLAGQQALRVAPSSQWNIELLTPGVYIIRRDDGSSARLLKL